jgi:heat induced stress protein YflT
MRTVTKVYDSYSQARQAVVDLEAAGISSSNISLVANKYVSEQYEDVDDVSEAATGAGLGALVGGTAGLLAGLGLLAIPGIGPVVAAGWLASTVLGVAAGGATGGIIGALVDAGEPEEHAHVYSEAVRRGGTLVSVKAEDQDVSRVQSILARHRPIDPINRGVEYKKSGWSRFDPKAPAYRPSDSEIERIRADYP